MITRADTERSRRRDRRLRRAQIPGNRRSLGPRVVLLTCWVSAPSTRWSTDLDPHDTTTAELHGRTIVPEIVRHAGVGIIEVVQTNRPSCRFELLGRIIDRRSDQ